MLCKFALSESSDFTESKVSQMWIAVCCPSKTVRQECQKIKFGPRLVSKNQSNNNNQSRFHKWVHIYTHGHLFSNYAFCCLKLSKISSTFPNSIFL